MRLALNYSTPAAELQRQGRIVFDLFKCPAWPDLVREVRQQYPVYVHFPLRVGSGTGEALDSETLQPADWRRVESLLNETDTPFVNVHLAPKPVDHPDLRYDSIEPGTVARIIECALRDLAPVSRRFGAERVVIENVYDYRARNLHAGFLPAVLDRVVRESGCGLLLDLSHARLAAPQFGLEIQAYLRQLPLARLRELHITGIQLFGPALVDRLRAANIEPETIRKYEGRVMDHLPMTPEDWTFTEWALAQIHQGLWPQPALLAFEYGGADSWWHVITSPNVLEEQVPRLRALARNGSE